MNKHSLYCEGMMLMAAFCDKNELLKPDIIEHKPEDWSFDVCAYYRNNEIHICIPRCANIGTAARAWSFPGYVVDRTPYGVIQHELGHHVDWSFGKSQGPYWSEYSKTMMEETGEKQITGYSPNHAEWFAEIFRLFVTNPDLLKRIRPLTYNRLITDGFEPIFTDAWCERLIKAPHRTLIAAGRKIA